MKLSDDTYEVIEQNYDTETAEYAKEIVEDYDSEFPNTGGVSQDVGLGVVMDQYRQTRAEEGLEAALEEFAEDLEETRQQGVLNLLAGEANSTEL